MKRYLLPWCITLIVAIWLMPGSHAAPREASKNDAALLKLQASVKGLTAERDAAKTELEAKTAEIEQLKKEKSAALASKQELSGALSAQQNAVIDGRERLAQTNNKLQEAQDKHRELTQAKAELARELSALKTQQQATEQQLAVCVQHNVKLYQSGAEVLAAYQNKGALNTLLSNEPVLQFQSVEMESIIQDYQDKLNADRLEKPAP